MDDRTVANELQHGSTESSLACRSCRKKKLKCDRIIPQCHNCMKLSRPCDYPATAHKPGPRPGTNRRKYDAKRTLEGRIRSIASRSSGNELSSTLAAKSSHSPSSMALSSHESPFSSACKTMGMPEHMSSTIISVFFDNMTSFGLFHQPTFPQKMASIDSAKHIQALLTSMLAFSIRFMKSSDLLHLTVVHPRDLVESACTLNNECLTDCGDETPPLHLLQGFVLVAWMLSVYGVRGKAGRLVSQCIKLAYELRLHEVDFEDRDKHALMDSDSSARSETWMLKEEQRRTWWAIWESDIFASSIQRLPSGVDWSRSRTLLPSTNEAWYSGTPAVSCYFRNDPNKRWRDLRDSGNKSPMAWFIILNSYKFESLSLTGRMPPPTTLFDDEEQLHNKSDSPDYQRILSRKREILENCLRCALGAMPASLQANDYQTFEPSRDSYPSMSLFHDHGVYMIHIMAQVTQLTLSRKDLEYGDYIAYPADLTHLTGLDGNRSSQVPTQGNIERKRWQRCLLCADKMAAMVRNAAPDHHKHVNPNLATALWMAAATLLTVLAYHRDDVDVELVQSNLDLLTTTIQSFIDFWDVPKTLVQSLTTLKQHLGFKRVDIAPLQQQRQQRVAADQSMATTSGSVTNGGGAYRSLSDFQSARSTAGMPEMSPDDPSLDLSPFDVLQAMDFGAMYNGINNWENLFLDPGSVPTGLGY